MTIAITGHHIDITEGLTSAVHKSLNKLFNHYPDLTTIHVTLKVEKHEQLAEAHTHYMGQDIVAHATDKDLYQSIAELRHKLETMLSKRKATVKSHSGKPVIAEPEEVD